MPEQTPPDLIDRRIAELGDWRGNVLAAVRQIAGPEIVEEWKWSGCPTICRTGWNIKNA